MTFDPSAPVNDEFFDDPELALLCVDCQTAEHLLIEAIEPSKPKIACRVAVEYSCGECGAFYAHDAAVEEIAKILNTGPSQPGVLRFGPYYIHCGEPMEEAGFQALPPNKPNKNPRGETTAASRPAALRCHCGFQIKSASPKEA